MQKGDRGEVNPAETEATGGAVPTDGGTVSEAIRGAVTDGAGDSETTVQLPAVPASDAAPAGAGGDGNARSDGGGDAGGDAQGGADGERDAAPATRLHRTRAGRTGLARLLSVARQGPAPFLAVAVLLVLTALGAVTVVAITRGPENLAPVDPQQPVHALPSMFGGTAGVPAAVPSVVASGTPSAVPSRVPPAMRSPTRAPGIPAVPTRPGAASPSPPAAPTTPADAPTEWTSLTVVATKALFRGDSLRTNRIQLEMRQDGDLVIVDENGTTRWRSGTAGAGSQATFQADGNFVVYNAAKQALWSSHTERHDGAVLVLQANGDVCVTDHGTSLWCAGTAH
ncbi:hypothetical protein [Rugosimonospora africana]|uniref:Bulb-type lectin domain-containing protein n=1 Tax=Rugosimonospora africana TaxID=556532 RepID=A0A8J3VUM8_9ACTN|nr:hypothetical protein [Rugosimonospora africana]GIH18823.1 hypothetical protein Raf01_69950 [Rugosimonospora africana]